MLARARARNLTAVSDPRRAPGRWEDKDGIVYGVTAALYPAIAIATLAISVNLVADWILNRTTSLKGGRNG